MASTSEGGGDALCDGLPELRHESQPPPELHKDKEGRDQHRLSERVEQRRLTPFKERVPRVELGVGGGGGGGGG